MGKRNLFYRGFGGQIKEIKPLCVLDVYVYERAQRGGHGLALFDVMFAHYKQSPEKLGYDRPSEKLISFNAKHFGLKSFVPQNNNFVVYDAYFQKPAPPS
jgi:alpha-tubulin N-acetyltransferase 1